jgi:hypothetical protein
MRLDLNNLPGAGGGIGDPHWLSGSGKVDRVGNHKRAQAAYLASLPPAPARPETTTKLLAVAARIRAKFAPAPAVEPDDAEHEHDAVAWAKHQRRMGQPKTLKIHGHELAHWARNIAAQDAERIHTAISVGLTAGEDNTDIAHRVIGSRRLNGSNGVTEITRQHILSLGKGLLHKRKSRMSGTSTDGPTK